MIDCAFKCDGQFSRVIPGIDIDPSYYVYVIDIERVRHLREIYNKLGEGFGDGQFSRPEDIAIEGKSKNCY